MFSDLARSSAPSRIVNVSSSAAHFGRVDPNKLNVYPIGLMANKRFYANTKLCNVLFTNELARKLTNTGVTTNSLHPGLVKTDIFRTLSPTLRSITYWVLVAMLKVISRTVVIRVYCI